jgi:hypothetical protein
LESTEPTAQLLSAVTPDSAGLAVDDESLPDVFASVSGGDLVDSIEGDPSPLVLTAVSEAIVGDNPPDLPLSRQMPLTLTGGARGWCAGCAMSVHHVVREMALSLLDASRSRLVTRTT